MYFLDLCTKVKIPGQKNFVYYLKSGSDSQKDDARLNFKKSLIIILSELSEFMKDTLIIVKEPGCQ